MGPDREGSSLPAPRADDGLPAFAERGGRALGHLPDLPLPMSALPRCRRTRPPLTCPHPDFARLSALGR